MSKKKQFPFVHPTTVLGPFVHPSSKGTVNREEEEGQKQQQKRGPKKTHCWAPRVGTDRAKEEEEEEKTAWQLEGGRVRQRMRTHSTTDGHLHRRREGVFLFLSVPCVEEVPFFCPSVASASSRSEGLLTSVPLSCDFYTFHPNIRREVRVCPLLHFPPPSLF